MKNKKTLKFSILRNLIIVLIVPIILMTILTNLYLERKLKKWVYKNNELITSQMETKIDDTFKNVLNDLTYLKSIMEQVDFSENDIDTILLNNVNKHHIIFKIQIVDELGYVTHIIPKDDAFINTDVSRTEYFKKVMENKKPCYSSVFVSRATNNPALTLTIPFKKGVITAYISLEKLNEIIEQLNLDDSTFVTITDQSSTFIGHSDIQKVKLKSFDENYEFYLNKKSNRLIKDIVNIKNKEYVSTIYFLKSNNWMVGVFQLKSKIKKPIYRLFIFTAGIVAILLIIVVFVAYKTVSHQMSPFEEFVDKLDNFAKGRDSFKGEMYSLKEFDNLSQSFNKMVEIILKRESDLKELNEKLEEELKERELSEKTFKTIFKNSNFAIGEDFFKDIAKTFSDWMEVKCVMISRLNEDNETVEVITKYVDGEFLDNYEYSIKDTPCSLVLENGFAHIEKDLLKLFPNDSNLQKINVESYAGMAIKDGTGENIGILCIIHDKPIKALKKRSKEVMTLLATRLAGEILRLKAVDKEKEIQKQLIQTQKFEAIGTLASGIAHDFNNILGAIIGTAESLEFRYKDDEKILKSTKTIIKSGDRAKEIVMQLLTFSREKQTEKRIVKVTSLIDEVVILLRSSIPANIKITKIINVKNDWILANSTEIHQILFNLGTNSSHAMENINGKLEFVVNEGENKLFISSEGKRINFEKYICIEVKDNGSGIPNEIKNRIFDPFFTTKEKGKGTGMGLSVAKRIVDNHGGFIQVDSEKNVGTTFKLYFRKADKENYEIETDKLVYDNMSARIFYVDDEIPLATPCVEMLQNFGCNVKYFDRSIEAFSHFKENKSNYDLIITDKEMPDMDGLVLIENIRKFSNIPIIISSGVLEKEYLENLGKDIFFIQKPFKYENLRGMISEILKNKLL